MRNEKLVMRNLVTVTLLAVLAACANGEMPESEQGGDMPIAFALSIGQGAQARVATDASTFQSNWENGDTVGIYAVRHANGVSPSLAATGNYINNGTLTYSGSWPISGAWYYPPGSDELDFYAYYPRQDPVSDVTNLVFTVKSDQSAANGADYNHSDLLLAAKPDWTRTSDSGRVPLVFSHAMALVEVYVSSNTTVTLRNVLSSATVDWVNLEATASGSAGDIVMYNVSGTTFRALVPPQTIAAGTNLFLFDNGYVSRALSGPVTLEKGTVTKYAVTLP